MWIDSIAVAFQLLLIPVLFAVAVLLGIKRVIYIIIAYTFFGLCFVWLLFYWGFIWI